MASYSIVRNLQTGEARFAIAASEAEVHYVFEPGYEIQGLNDARIARLLALRGHRPPPTRETPWTQLAMTNVGYFAADPLVETKTLEDAVAAALKVLLPAGNDTVDG